MRVLNKFEEAEAVRPSATESQPLAGRHVPKPVLGAPHTGNRSSQTVSDSG
jgi:hypothetical protein